MALEAAFLKTGTWKNLSKGGAWAGGRDGLIQRWVQSEGTEKGLGNPLLGSECPTPLV